MATLCRFLQKIRICPVPNDRVLAMHRITLEYATKEFVRMQICTVRVRTCFVDVFTYRDIGVTWKAFAERENTTLAFQTFCCEDEPYTKERF